MTAGPLRSNLLILRIFVRLLVVLTVGTAKALLYMHDQHVYQVQNNCSLGLFASQQKKTDMQNNTCAMRDATTDFPSPLFCHTKKNVDSWSTTTATQKFIIARFSLVSFLSFFAGKRDECLSHKMFLQGRSTGFSQMRKKES